MKYWVNTCVVAVASLGLAASLYAQTGPEKTKEVDKKKASKTVDVQVKVSTTEGKPLPAGSAVEVSGHESACGNLTDLTAAVNDQGEATFRNLPPCKITVKVNLPQFMPAIKGVDLATYRSCAQPAPAGKNGGSAPAPPACDPVLLELVPLSW